MILARGRVVVWGIIQNTHSGRMGDLVVNVYAVVKIEFPHVTPVVAAFIPDLFSSASSTIHYSLGQILRFTLLDS